MDCATKTGQEILTNGTPLTRYGIGVLYAGATVRSSAIDGTDTADDFQEPSESPVSRRLKTIRRVRRSRSRDVFGRTWPTPTFDLTDADASDRRQWPFPLSAEPRRAAPLQSQSRLPGTRSSLCTSPGVTKAMMMVRLPFRATGHSWPRAP